MLKVLIALAVKVYVVDAASTPIAPTTIPTRGSVWPQPHQQNDTQEILRFTPSRFEFKITNTTCDILEKAIVRYKEVLKHFYEIGEKNRAIPPLAPPPDTPNGGNVTQRDMIKELRLEMKQPCRKYPHFLMDESYNLSVSSVSVLKSKTVWGMLRGLETFSQLFHMSDDNTEIVIKGTKIYDFPNYPHRGLMLDTARHYISVSNILKTLDAMAINKMNVFHWHIIDDQSFPLQSEKFPELSERGAFHPSLVYTKEKIKHIVEYARERGIRVVPEIDVPGHTLSWAASHPDLLTECYDFDDTLLNRKPVRFGPLHPFKKGVYKIIRDLYAEVQSWFPDKFFHIGGDEVDLNCWASNPAIQNVLLKYNVRGGVKGLFAKFSNKVLHFLENKSNPIVWEEVFITGADIPDNAIIQVWNIKGELLARMLEIGVNVISSTGWYLDHQEDRFDWFYRQEPRENVRELVERTNGSILLQQIMGGEACMWTERADDSNIHSRIWPRASAVAEVLWSVTHGKIDNSTYRRIEEHTCRMIQRGIPTEPPRGPGFCLY